jgi:hypothetical protein
VPHAYVCVWTPFHRSTWTRVCWRIQQAVWWRLGRVPSCGLTETRFRCCTQNIKIWDVETETVVAEVKSMGFNASIVQW